MGATKFKLTALVYSLGFCAFFSESIYLATAATSVSDWSFKADKSLGFPFDQQEKDFDARFKVVKNRNCDPTAASAPAGCDPVSFGAVKELWSARETMLAAAATLGNNPRKAYANQKAQFNKRRQIIHNSRTACGEDKECAKVWTARLAALEFSERSASDAMINFLDQKIATLETEKSNCKTPAIPVQPVPSSGPIQTQTIVTTPATGVPTFSAE